MLFRIILYAIAMADYDQENTEIREDVLTTKDGIDRLALYNSSVGRLVVVLSVSFLKTVVLSSYRFLSSCY